MSGEITTVTVGETEFMPARTGGGRLIKTFNEGRGMREAIYQSGLAPPGFKKPEAIFVAIATGMELGLRPMQSLQAIAVINGKTSIYGDAALALVRSSGKLEWIKETIEGTGEKMFAV